MHCPIGERAFGEILSSGHTRHLDRSRHEVQRRQHAVDFRVGRVDEAVVDLTTSFRDEERVALSLREQEGWGIAARVFGGVGVVRVGVVRVGDLKGLDLFVFLGDAFEILRCKVGAIFESLERSRVGWIPGL